MAAVIVKNVKPTTNPARFDAPFELEITFECSSLLSADLDFKFTYVGSSEDNKYDQELDSISVGPIPVGVSQFVFEAPPPKPELIPRDSLMGATVVLLTCSYKGNEFVNVGYYVNNDYNDSELSDDPPEIPDYTKLFRNILTEKPCVTRMDIDWD